jgi:hypothetical protein
MKESERERWYTEAAAASNSSSRGPRRHYDLVFNVEQEPKDSANVKHYSPGKLFTWNRSWMLDNLEYLDLVRRLHSVPDALAAAVKELDEIKSLFADLVLVCANILEQFKCRDFSCCMEISMHSEDLGRIHLHAFTERHLREDKCWWSWDAMDRMLVVREVNVSHGNICLARTRGRNRERALTEGHYYCQALKIGHVCHHSTKPIFENIFSRLSHGDDVVDASEDEQ